MKKILSVLLCVLLLFTATACEIKEYPVPVYTSCQGVENFAKTLKKDVDIYDVNKRYWFFKVNGQEAGYISIGLRQTGPLIYTTHEYLFHKTYYSTEYEHLGLTIWCGDGYEFRTNEFGTVIVGGIEMKYSEAEIGEVKGGSYPRIIAYFVTTIDGVGIQFEFNVYSIYETYFEDCISLIPRILETKYEIKVS